MKCRSMDLFKYARLMVARPTCVSCSLSASSSPCRGSASIKDSQKWSRQTAVLDPRAP